MRFHRSIACPLLAVMALTTGPADLPAQTLEQRGYRPVAQMREDVDPLARSLEHIHAGLRTTGERSNVYRPLRGDRRLFYISQGVVAEFDRSDYRITDKGQVLQYIPPNTVFHIGPPPPQQQVVDDRPPPDQMVNAAVGARIHARTDAAVLGAHRSIIHQPPAVPPYHPGQAGGLTAARPDPTDQSLWLAYRIQCQRQRRILTAALTQSAGW